jgi:hypothetical protein
VAPTGLFLSRDSAACITATIGPPRGGQPFNLLELHPYIYRCA